MERTITFSTRQNENADSAPGRLNLIVTMTFDRGSNFPLIRHAAEVCDERQGILLNLDWLEKVMMGRIDGFPGIGL